jgi:hypothetical protein
MILACNKDEDLCVKNASFDASVETLNQTDLSKAESLFAENNLNYDNKRFTSLTETETNIIVKGYQYVNGLKIFTEPLSYYFRKSVPQRLDFILGDTLLSASINPGSTPQMDSETVISLYKSIIEADEKIDWNESLCYVVEFGYYDLNVSTNIDQVNYVQAWKIKPEGGSVPLVFINDITKELIYYDNGIRSKIFNNQMVNQIMISNKWDYNNVISGT